MICKHCGGAIEAELAQQAEPVAWALGDPRYCHSSNIIAAHEFTPDAEHRDEWAPLYTAPLPSAPDTVQVPRSLDTDRQVFFYEQEFYVLSNFSAFTLQWKGLRFDTSEAAYHWEKFTENYTALRDEIRTAPSAHEAFKLAERNKHCRRHDWDEVKVSIMLDILRAKVDQHEYVRRKLLETGNRELVENSWRDGYWGWGPNRDGQNLLGKLWMLVRAELIAAAPKSTP